MIAFAMRNLLRARTVIITGSSRPELICQFVPSSWTVRWLSEEIVTTTTTRQSPNQKRYTTIPHRFFFYWLPKYRKHVSESLGRFIKKRTYRSCIVSFCHRLEKNKKTIHDPRNNHAVVTTTTTPDDENWNRMLAPLMNIGLTDATTVVLFLNHTNAWEQEHKLPKLRERYLQAMEELRTIQHSIKELQDKKDEYYHYRTRRKAIDDQEQIEAKTEEMKKLQEQVKDYFDKITSLPIYPNELQFSKKKFLQMKSMVEKTMPNIVAAFTQHVRETIDLPENRLPTENDAMTPDEKTTSKEDEVEDDVIEDGQTKSDEAITSEEVKNIANFVSRMLKKKKWKDMALQQLEQRTHVVHVPKIVYSHNVALSYREMRHKPQAYVATLESLKNVGLGNRELGDNYIEGLEKQEQHAQIVKQIRQLVSDEKIQQQQHSLACQQLTEQVQQLETSIEVESKFLPENDGSRDLRIKIYQDKIAAAKNQIHERNQAIGYLYQNKLSLLQNLKRNIQPALSEEDFQRIEKALNDVMPGIVDTFVVNLIARLDKIQEKPEATISEKKSVPTEQTK